MYQIVVINPGSTSTKVALYQDKELVFSENISHPAEKLAEFAEISDQRGYRYELVLELLQKHQVKLEDTDAFAAICTGLRPMPGGTYEINETMVADALIGPGSKHPGNLGPLLAADFAAKFGGRAFTTDPSSVDEFTEKARVTGFAEIFRTSRGHPLNQRAVARKFAQDQGKQYEELNLVVAHLGGGISVSVHEKGKMVDTVDSTRGEGRMAPTRSGTAPLADVIELCYSGKYTKKEMLQLVMKKGGWVAHLGTSDTLEVQERIAAGDAFAKLIFETTVYQIAKDIAAMASVVCGKVDAILLTGGMVRSEMLCRLIEERVAFLAPVYRYPGEFEMEALALGALGVLEGKTKPLSYTGEPVFRGFSGR